MFQTLKMDSFQKITPCNEPSSNQINVNEFNTMQQLFATQAPQSAQINLNVFTMQQLFATQAGIKKESEPNKAETKENSAFEEFHTIQCVFDTKNMNKFSTFTQDLALTSTNKVNNTNI